MCILSIDPKDMDQCIMITDLYKQLIQRDNGLAQVHGVLAIDLDHENAKSLLANYNV